MTLEDLLHLTRRRFGSLALAIVICVLLSVAFAFVTPSSYTATAQAYLHVEVGGDPGLNTQSHYNAAQLADLKAESAVPVFTSEAVAQRVIESLKLDVTPEELASSVSATRTPETVSVQVSVEASTSRQAQVLADEVVRQTAEEVTELEGSDSPVKISLLSSAELVSATRSPALVTCVGVGLLAGLVLGYVWILVQELLDKSLKGPEDVRKALSAPVLGVLPKDPSPLRLGRGAQTEVEERLRATRTNVLHALSHGARQVVVVTSAGPREGASTTAAGLARVLALSGHRVVLVGGDLRSPSAVGAPGAPGLAEVLVGTARLSQVLVAVPSQIGVDVTRCALVQGLEPGLRVCSHISYTFHRSGCDTPMVRRWSGRHRRYREPGVPVSRRGSGAWGLATRRSASPRTSCCGLTSAQPPGCPRADPR